MSTMWTLEIQVVLPEKTPKLHLSLFEEPIQVLQCKLANVYQRDPDSRDRAANNLSNIMNNGEEVVIEVLFWKWLTMYVLSTCTTALIPNLLTSS